MAAEKANGRKVTVFHDPSRYTCQVGAVQLHDGHGLEGAAQWT